MAVNTSSGVSALYGKQVVAIAAGGHHSLALCSDGTLAAWGLNAQGQLGDNTQTNRLVPVDVNKDSGVSALYGKTVADIAAGGWNSVALCSDGTVTAWGWNGYGQIGDNTLTNRLTAVAVNTALLGPGERAIRVSSSSSYWHNVALVAAPLFSPITLAGARTLTDGSFQFAFTNTPGALFGVLSTTNPALPLSNWTVLGGATEVSPGQFQFTDPQERNNPHLFYRVRSP